MKRHFLKKDFSVVATSVIALEVLAFVVFIFGVTAAVYNMFLNPPLLTIWGFLFVVLGATIISFVLLVAAEFLQLILKIEVNTRKMERIMEGKAPRRVVAKKGKK